MIRHNFTKKLIYHSPLARSISGETPVATSKMAASRNEAVPSILELLPDPPSGPLSVYRKNASFDWRKMKLAVEGEDMIRYKNKIWSFLRSHEIFNKGPESLPLDEERHLAQKRMRMLKTGEFLRSEDIAINPNLLAGWTEAIYMYDVSTAIKYGLVYQMFVNVILAMGSPRHYKFVEGSDSSEISGAFALTEFAHGSNAKGLRTTATYDVESKEFILHSADFEAAKCWVGNLGKSATHAIIYAKLITADGMDQGLHAFVAPIRCPRTMRPFAGVTVGDLGEKIALNGVDNGFVMFNSYHIPAENLLNKHGDVDEKGNYVSPFKDPSKRFGASLGVLSGGRVHIGGMATNQLQKALTIAIRYSAVRKQFGPDDSNVEFPVLEYQQQQFRLLPYLATCFATRIFYNWIAFTHTTYLVDSMLNAEEGRDPWKGMEIHGLSSSTKPVITWLARDGIQVCREACGGHGYLKATGIGDIRNENDANCTYEGENSILIQQTSNWLLSLWRSIQKGEEIHSPFGTAGFLKNHKSYTTPRSPATPKDATHPEFLLNAYKWLVIYNLKLTADKIDRLSKEGKSSFTVRNETQAYHAAILSMTFAEHAILQNFYTFSSKVENQQSRDVLMKLVSLFGAWILEKHLATLYMGKYITGNTGQLLRDGILVLCEEVKPDAVTLVDAFAPPDFILNSVLGSSDGRVYQNLQSSIFSYPGALSRPHWWKDIVNWKSYVTSKI